MHNLDFEYIAILLSLTLLVVYWGRRKVSLPKYRIYYISVIMTVLTSVSHISLEVVRKQNLPNSHNIIIGLYIVYTFLILALLVSLTIYILFLANIDFVRSSRWHFIIVAPIAIAEACYLTTHITHLFTWYDSDNILHIGPLHFLIYVLFGYYLLLWLYISRKYKEIIGNEESMFIRFFVVSGILVCVAQYITGYDSLFSFAVSVCLSIIIYAVKNPDEIVDSTGAMYKSYFLDETKSDYIGNNEFTVIFIRIKDVKSLIDTYGSDDIAMLLSMLVKNLGSFKYRSFVYRIDESTFALRLKKIDDAKANEIANSIQAKYEQPVHIGDVEVKLEIGKAIIQVPEDYGTVEEFMRMLSFIGKVEMEEDRVLYKKDFAKEENEWEIIQIVKKAVNESGFQVYYQPIYSTKKKTIVAAEALIRLYDEKLGFISPEVFIPLAEREGLILKIGEYVFEEVCKFYSENKLKEKGIDYIEVNLSAIQCMQFKLAEDFVALMKRYGVNADQINFEITETSAMISNTTVSKNISYFVNNGVDLSLDDYGTGYSNLSYLYHLPFSFMKIDKSILWSSDKNDKANVALRNIFKMARNLDMRTVVEGVETEEHIKKLLELKCDYFQGYYFSKPIPGKDFLDYIDGFVNPKVCEK